MNFSFVFACGQNATNCTIHSIIMTCLQKKIKLIRFFWCLHGFRVLTPLESSNHQMLDHFRACSKSLASHLFEMLLYVLIILFLHNHNLVWQLEFNFMILHTWTLINIFYCSFRTLLTSKHQRHCTKSILVQQSPSFWWWQT